MPSWRMSFQPSTNPAAYPFVHQLRTRFAETDAMSVVHHAAYLAYLEEARVEYLRSLGHPYGDVRAEGLDFPILEVAVRYQRPLRFDDVVDVHIAVASVQGATFEMAYLLGVNGVACATAVTVHGVVGRHGRATRTPGWLRQLVPPA